MARSCFSANRAYIVGGGVIILCLWGALHPTTKQRLGFSEEVKEAVAHAIDAPAQPRDELAFWGPMHETLVQELRVAKKQGVDVLWYGDSITEALRGTNMGKEDWNNGMFQEVRKVFQQHFPKLKTAVLAIGGDTTHHLLWRIQNGEGPDDVNPKAIVVNIGTNDFSAYHADTVSSLDIPSTIRAARVCRVLSIPHYTGLSLSLGTQACSNAPQIQEAEDTGAAVSSGVIAVCEQLLEHAPSAKLLLVGILPKGDRHVEAPAVRPLVPNRFTPAIEATNDRLESYASGRRQVTFLDCSQVFYEDHGRVEGGKKIDVKLMPDVLHPNAAGWDTMLNECIQPQLAKVVKT